MSELEKISQELSAIGRSKIRVAIISLIVMLLVITSMIGAYSEAKTETNGDRVTDLRAAAAIAEADPEVPPLFDALYPGERYDPNKTTEVPSDTAAARLYFEKQYLANAKADSIRAVLDSAQSRAFRKLVVEYSFLGVKLPIHLGHWGALLPFIAVFAVAYLIVIGAKERCIYAVGAYQLSKINDATALEKLTFEGNSGRFSPFLRFPGQLTTVMYGAALIIVVLVAGMLLSPFVLAQWRQYQGADGSERVDLMLIIVWPALKLIGLAVAFVAAYSMHAARELTLVSNKVMGLPSPRSGITTKIIQVGHLIAAKAEKVPRIAAALIGAVPTWATLFLFVAVFAGTCETPDPHTGFDLMTDQGSSIKWFTAVTQAGGGLTGDFVHWLGRTVYAMQLVLGLVAIFLAIAYHAQNRKTHRGKMWNRVYKLGIAAAIYAVVDVGLDAGLGTPYSVPLRISVWLLITHYWWAAVESDQEPGEWFDGRLFMAASLALPVLAVALIRLYELSQLNSKLVPGAAAYVVGALGLLTTYSLFYDDATKMDTAKPQE